MTRGDHPMNCVDWMAADAFCKWKGQRLPTSNEWEWAARGGPRGTLYPWGADAPKGQLCWSGIAKNGSTCGVASFVAGNDPNGISDLAGNVGEWTADVQPGITTRHIARDGSWFETSPSDFGWQRVRYVKSEVRNNGLGFRCAATPM